MGLAAVMVTAEVGGRVRNLSETSGIWDEIKIECAAEVCYR
ncbi:hypothetical protein L195_g063470 [Trifolium pratense]|uniref:Uncharacterized protein n=1 Tax=Trifolium pratense TaxID=57577 RepID=A0A2K3KLZ9_TRIPR|nr:hypothetical protein L195_g063470 [Trifolium pratense]